MVTSLAGMAKDQEKVGVMEDHGAMVVNNGHTRQEATIGSKGKGEARANPTGHLRSLLLSVP